MQYEKCLCILSTNKLNQRHYSLRDNLSLKLPTIFPMLPHLKYVKKKKHYTIGCCELIFRERCFSRRVSYVFILPNTVRMCTVHRYYTEKIYKKLWYNKNLKREKEKLSNTKKKDFMRHQYSWWVQKQDKCKRISVAHVLVF